ncbi:hypothetical protein SY89_03453 [Halolamina pelagica]|uniref:Uncharacterized protein n=1 Tax=Halolamina pelagica TaxID=699431 RepID=A0A0N8HZD7_9EURY|nr:hypothetical protein SY89_03453 [Halolamina pelagica]
MYPPTQKIDRRPYRNPPTLGVALLMAALPLAVLFVVAFPAVATGFFAGAAIRTALPP